MRPPIYTIIAIAVGAAFAIFRNAEAPILVLLFFYIAIHSLPGPRGDRR